MFTFAALLLFWALFTFGAVLSDSSLAIMLFWFAAITSLTIWRIHRNRLDWVVIAVLTSAGFAFFYWGPKVALWAFAFLWTWDATRNTPRKVFQYFRILVGIGFFEAGLGLVQYLVAPGWILGYHNVGSLVSGTLINRNHFAGLMEMLIPCCIGLGFVAIRGYGNAPQAYVFVLLGAFMAVGLAFSLSRMGIFSFVSSLIFLSVVLALRKSERRFAAALGLGLVGLLLAGVCWIGADVILEQYSKPLDSDLQEGRGGVYRDTMKMIWHLPLGVGMGRYQDAFRRFQTTHLEVLYDHAHNDYLETAAEWGLPIAVPVWIAIFLIFVSIVRALFNTESIEAQGILLTCATAIFSILLHSLIDFNLQIPSNAMLFFSYLGIGLGMVFPAGEAADFAA
jgi:O-antigen ligase